MPRHPRRSCLGGSRGVPVLVPVRASPVPSVVRGSFVVKFFSIDLFLLVVETLFRNLTRSVLPLARAGCKDQCEGSGHDDAAECELQQRQEAHRRPLARAEAEVAKAGAVSYTHLTLPTKVRV